MRTFSQQKKFPAEFVGRGLLLRDCDPAQFSATVMAKPILLFAVISSFLELGSHGNQFASQNANEGPAV